VRQNAFHHIYITKDHKLKKHTTMKKNMGSIDKIIRILAAVVIVILFLSDQITGVAAIVLLALSGIFILTSFMSFCPLYLPFGISTNKKKDNH
jgi:uncharacterized membrane protein